MDDILMCNPNDDTQNHPLSRFKLMVETFKNLMKQPIKISPQNY